MAVVSTCPECAKAVTVPDRLGSDARVRCPLCEAEYLLGEATADAPPELVVLDPGSVPPEETAAAFDAAAEAAEGFELTAVGAEAGELVEPGAETDTEFEAADQLDAEETEGAEVGAAVAEGGEGEEEGEAGPMLDIWHREEAAPEIDFGGGGPAAHAAVDASAFAGFGEEEEAEGAPGEKRPISARPGRRRKQKSVVKEMVGAILGGFAGLAIGYYLLNYFGGERFDFMQIWLPFVEHTQKHWPGEKPDASAEKESDETAKQGGTASQPKRPAAARNVPPETPAPPEPEPEPAPSPGGFAFDPMDQGGPAVPGPTMEDPKIELDGTLEPEPTVGLRRPPSYTSNELGEALAEANQALNGEQATGEITPEVYDKFCTLGQRVTFVKAGGPQVADRKQAVQKLLEQIAADPLAVHQLGQLAVTPLEDAAGDDYGVLVAGIIGTIREKDGLYATPLKAPGIEQTQFVMSTRPLSLPEGQRVLVLGSTVHSPVEKVIDYSGGRPLVIWFGMGVAIPKPEPLPEPASRSVLEPEPEPTPKPAALPEPGPAPPPEPGPEPEPTLTPEPAPSPAPEPAPLPADAEPQP